MFFIQSDLIVKGKNTIIISKKSDIIEEPILILSKNNNSSFLKYSIENNKIVVDLNIKDKSNYKILLKERNETFTFPLVYSEYKAKENYRFKADISYLKGVIQLSIISNKLVEQGFPISLTGDLSGTYYWNSNSKTFNISIVKLIVDCENLKFKINEQPFAINILDKDKFPSSLIKIGKIVKLNKICKYPLTLKINNEVIIIEPNTRDILINWDSDKLFEMSYCGVIIFSQKIKKSKSIPNLVLTTNPLRAKIGFPVLEQIELQLKGIDGKLFIPAGSTETIIPSKAKGVTEIEILKVTNANAIKTKWKLIL